VSCRSNCLILRFALAKTIFNAHGSNPLKWGLFESQLCGESFVAGWFVRVTILMNPYRDFVSSFARLVSEGKSLPLGQIPRPKRPSPAPDAPVALIFSPHPDDECIIGGLALRLMREAGMRVINVAVTLGSSKERQPGRLQELTEAC